MRKTAALGPPKKRRIIVLICFLLFIGFAAVCSVSYYATLNVYKKSLSESILPLTGDTIYSEIRKDIIELVLISSLMSNDTFLIDWILNEEKDAALISKYLKTIQEKYNTVTCFFASNVTGSYYHPTGLFTTVDRNNPRDEWFFKTRDAWDDYQINLGIDDANEGALTIFINHKVFDYDGNFIGITGCGLTVENVMELLDDYARRYNRIIYFVDERKNVLLANSIAPPSFSNIDDVPDFQILPPISEDKETHSVSYSRDNEEYLLNTRYLPELDLYLFVEQSLNSSDRQHVRKRLFLKIFLITLPIGLIIVLSVLKTANVYQAELELLATTDRLTQASNRYAFEIVFTQAFREAERRNRPLTLILYDIDYFKRINDEYGHPAGDAVLKSVAEVTRKMLREADSLCRWGGEEFLILLQDCDLENGRLIAEELRRTIRDTAVVHSERAISVRISLGVAQWNNEETRKDLLQRVDEALYRAKKGGRNRVETA